jgi:hypothetical protein
LFTTASSSADRAQSMLKCAKKAFSLVFFSRTKSGVGKLNTVLKSYKEVLFFISLPAPTQKRAKNSFL